MRQARLHQLLWLPLAVLVLLTPTLLNATLDAIGQAPVNQQATDSPTDRSALKELPSALPVRLDETPMSAHHTQPRQAIYHSEYTNTLATGGDGLVPYIPRLFDINQFTLLNQSNIEINGEPYHRFILRKKFSQRHYLGYYQYRVGRIHTNSYAKAKLFQLPAAFTGANQFALVVWQTECEQASCQTERDRLQNQLIAR
jgi:hypothetical protein